MLKSLPFETSSPSLPNPFKPVDFHLSLVRPRLYMTFIFWTNRLPPIQSHPNLVEHLEVLVDDSDLNPYHTIPWQKPWCGAWHHWNPSFCSQVTARRIPVPLPMAPKKSAMMVSIPRYQSIPINSIMKIGWLIQTSNFQLPYLKTKTSGALKLSFQPFYIILVATVVKLLP